MFGSEFYFSTLKKYVTMFGSLFDDIYISRFDSTGEAEQTLKVPISYGPKERYMTRGLQNPDLLRPVSMVFPRMSFYITSLQYDEARKLNTIGSIRNDNTNKELMSYQYNPVPYNIMMRLSIIARNAEDGLQIVEQILPYFTPEWTVTLNLIDDMNDPKDIPVIIKDVTTEEHYEGSFESKQFITWDLDFVLKGYLFGPKTKAKIIKEIFVNFFTPETNTAAEGVGISTVQEHIYIRPGLDANGNPTSNVSASVPISQISSNSNYAIIDEIINDATR